MSNPKVVYIKHCPEQLKRDHSRFKCVEIVTRPQDDEQWSAKDVERQWCGEESVGFIYWTFKDGVKVLNYFCDQHIAGNVCKVFTGENVVLHREHGDCLVKKAIFTPDSYSGVDSLPCCCLFVGSNTLMSADHKMRSN